MGTLISSFPNQLSFNGGVYPYSGEYYNREEYGAFWTTKVFSSLDANNIWFGSTSTKLYQNNIEKLYGYSVRCVGEYQAKI